MAALILRAGSYFIKIQSENVRALPQFRRAISVRNPSGGLGGILPFPLKGGGGRGPGTTVTTDSLCDPPLFCYFQAVRGNGIGK